MSHYKHFFRKIVKARIEKRMTVAPNCLSRANDTQQQQLRTLQLCENGMTEIYRPSYRSDLLVF